MLKKIYFHGPLILLFLSCLVGEAAEKKALFAGGCFWCMEKPFEEIEGVKTVISGYTGGSMKNPTYQQVSSGETGHIEAVEVLYDDQKVGYEDLLWVFWRQIDPTDPNGQFVDKGPQYISAIFYLDSEQKKLAEKTRALLQKSGKFDKKIVTEIRKGSAFYPAEDYHQNYYKTHSFRYRFYRSNSGRDQYLDAVWGKDRKYRKGKKKY